MPSAVADRHPSLLLRKAVGYEDRTSENIVPQIEELGRKNFPIQTHLWNFDEAEELLVALGRWMTLGGQK